jgi:hypothetical protein
MQRFSRGFRGKLEVPSSLIWMTWAPRNCSTWRKEGIVRFCSHLNGQSVSKLTDGAADATLSRDAITHPNASSFMVAKLSAEMYGVYEDFQVGRLDDYE